MLVESSDAVLCNPLVAGGVARTGVNALRKSVYAEGGVMGVHISRLMTEETQEMGVLMTSDGKEAELGV